MKKTISKIAAVDILEQICRAIELSKKEKRQSNKRLDYLFFFGGVIPYVLALLLALPFLFKIQNKFYASYLEIVRNLCLGLLGVAYVCLLVYLIATLTGGLKDLFIIFKQPSKSILSLAQETAENDAPLYAYLLTQKLIDLKYARVQLNAENEYFGKRVSLIVGAVSKIGLVPAFFAYVSTILKLDIDALPYIKWFAYIAPAFYIIAILEVPIRSQFDRYLALLDLTIAQKETDITRIKKDTMTSGRLIGSYK